MIIYVVTSGSYSDYGIEAVFMKKVAAEMFIRIAEAAGETDYNIEEHEAADDRFGPESAQHFIRAGKPYRVILTEGGDLWSDGLVGYHFREAMRDEVKFIRLGRNDETSGAEFYLWAKSKEAAIKVANERRSFILANNLWGKDSEGWPPRIKEKELGP